MDLILARGLLVLVQYAGLQTQHQHRVARLHGTTGEHRHGPGYFNRRSRRQTGRAVGQVHGHVRVGWIGIRIGKVIEERDDVQGRMETDPRGEVGRKGKADGAASWL